MPDPRVTFDTSLFCDVIRREDNGKAILIGVYNQDIIVAKLPAQLVLSTYINGVRNDLKEPLNLEFRIMYKDTMVAHARTVLTVNPNESAFTVVLPGFALSVDVEKPLFLEVRPESGQWEKLKKLNVRQRAKESETA